MLCFLNEQATGPKCIDVKVRKLTNLRTLLTLQSPT